MPFITDMYDANLTAIRHRPIHNPEHHQAECAACPGVTWTTEHLARRIVDDNVTVTRVDTTTRPWTART